MVTNIVPSLDVWVTYLVIFDTVAIQVFIADVSNAVIIKIGLIGIFYTRTVILKCEKYCIGTRPQN